jgi:phosphoadenosine phosphosulfate reductase
MVGILQRRIPHNHPGSQQEEEDPITSPQTETSRRLLAEAKDLDTSSAEVLLAWAESRFGGRAAIASSFAVEDAVLIHLASLYAPSIRVFTLDTGRLPPETFEVMEEVRQRYGIAIESWFPDRAAVELLEREKGFFSFRQSVSDRKDCCAIRKQEPLTRALSGKLAWLTASRRALSPVRIEVAELDPEHGGIIKLNPLARWTEEDVWSYARSHSIPINTLHVRGYPSIDCAPCTRAVAPGEDGRTGRWWWEASLAKEGKGQATPRRR